MAHCEKFARAAIGNMCNHYERSGDKKRSNENIKSELTCQNYNLAPEREMTQVEFINQRMSEVRCQKRADVNIMCDWVVTIPKDFQATYPEKEREFFQNTYDFLAKRYGEKNVISAYVHKDEVTPHLHFAFMPITADKRRGGEKVCANDVITRADLRSFHGDLQQHLETTLGVSVNILNEATKDGNKSIAELRRQSAAEQVAEAKEQAIGMLGAAKNKAAAITDAATKKAAAIVAAAEEKAGRLQAAAEIKQAAADRAAATSLAQDKLLYTLSKKERPLLPYKERKHLLSEPTYEVTLDDVLKYESGYGELRSCKEYLSAVDDINRAWAKDYERLRGAVDKYEQLEQRYYQRGNKLEELQQELKECKQKLYRMEHYAPDYYNQCVSVAAKNRETCVNKYKFCKAEAAKLRRKSPSLAYAYYGDTSSYSKWITSCNHDVTNIDKSVNKRLMEVSTEKSKTVKNKSKNKGNDGIELE